MKNVLLAMIPFLAISAYAQQDGSENNCHYNPEYRQTLVENYNDALHRYEELKNQQTDCYERCKFNNRNNTSLYSCDYCNNGILIVQAVRTKEDRKFKIFEYDEKTNGCRN
jgi:hypothetical protein